MRPTEDGWLHRKPLVKPETCRHCDGPLVVVRNATSGVGALACVDCDMTERWPQREG